MKLKFIKFRFNPKSLIIRMVLMFAALLISMNGIFFAIAIMKSSDALNKSIVDAMNGIAERSGEMVYERIHNYFSELYAVGKHHLLQHIHMYRRDICRLFMRIAEEQGHKDIIVADHRGNGFSGTGIDISIADREYFQQVMQGKDALGEPFHSSFYDGDFVMVFAIPLRDNNDNIIGLLGIVRDGYEISNLLSDITYGETGYAFAVNEAGTFVGHQDTSVVDSFENMLVNAATNEEKSLAEHIEKMAAREKGWGTYEKDGDVQYISYVPIVNYPWSLALTVPQKELNSSIVEMRQLIIGTDLILLALGIAASTLMAFSIRRPILKLENVANQFAKGNLDVTVDTRRRDELGSLANSLQIVASNMNELIGNIWTAAEQVASGSRQISDSSIGLSQGVTEQASSVEELTASLEQMSSQTKLNAENADETSKLARLTETTASLGNQKMQNMLHAMNDISASSRNISRVIKVIDDIAFQTNILALNAAVEAAHAGQHGKGFAVVADEVRNLAAKSAEAARETTDMIENSIEQIKEGMRLAEETAKEFARIVEEVSKAAELVENISVASKEQSAGIEQISRGVMQVSQVVQSNSATSQEVAAASEQLSGQAEILKEQVSKFNLKKHNQNGSESLEDEEISPEVLQALEDMRAEKGGKKEVGAGKGLSDKEFGKY
ncbi:MAG TPA: HAMP domain-containing protein [Clostridiales bacterium]|nr:HAMP domain-containing protein [Clostridiales bacterium]